jgi:hypothetical protein
VFLQMLSYFFQSISWKVVNLKFQQKNKNLIVYLKKRSLYVRTSLFVLFFTFYLFCSFGTCFRNLTADRHALGLQIKSRLQHSGKKNWKTSKTQKHSKKNWEKSRYCEFKLRSKNKFVFGRKNKNTVTGRLQIKLSVKK